MSQQQIPRLASLARDDRPRRAIVALALAAVVVAIVSWRQVQRRDALRASGAQAVVVLGELGGPDSVLSLAAREALRAELANTRGVRML